MDILDAIKMMFSLVLVALIFGVYACVVHIYNTSKSKKSWGDLNATGAAHYTYPKTTIPAAIMPVRKKPNILEWFLDSTACMLGLVTIISAFPILYFIGVLLEISYGLVLLFFFILISPICYAVIYVLHFGISAVIWAVVMLILKIMNKKIPAGKIYRTAVYASAPMVEANICTCLNHFAFKFDYISTAITAGLMFCAIKYILKKQEPKYIYISAAIRQHIRQHGCMHAAF